MVKNAVISVISPKENEENRGSIEFQVFGFTTKIRRLTSHLELLISERFAKKIWKASTAAGLFVKKRYRGHYKELIGELNIREIKTR